VSRPRRLAALAGATALLALASGLAGCTATVSLTPADAADDPACAGVTARLPATADGQERRWTDAQATGAWGDPAVAVLHCGVDVPGPSTLPCQTVGGVDWLIDDADAPDFRFTTFGRDPAVEVYLDSEVASGRAVLEALAPAVATLPTTGAVCTAPAAG
jgi:hypothetical protein